MERGNQKTVRGTVISDKSPKTIVVKAERRVKHIRYGKYVRRYTTYHAHDEHEEAKPGDIVELSFTRPISKLKRWRLREVITRFGVPVGKEGVAEGGEE